jgi:DNA-binding PadR family transcriptional regulator
MVRLEERGLLSQVEPEEDAGDARRKTYGLTALGKRVLEAESRRLAELVSIARSADVLPEPAE